MKYIEVEHPAPSKSEQNKLVNWRDKIEGGIHIAVNRRFVVNYPVVYITKSGKRYIEHKQLQRSPLISNPDCKCHERTYLPVWKNYTDCDVCEQRHYVKCAESTFHDNEQPEFLETKNWDQPGFEDLDDVLCSTCYAQRLNELIAKEDQDKRS